MSGRNTDWISVTQLLVNIVTIAGFFIVLIQLHDGHTTESAALMFQINSSVRSGITSHLVADIDAGNPIFEPKGKYTIEDVDNYLMNWELLANAYDSHLIDTNTLYDAFSYDIEKAWRNPEIQKYIQDSRTGENDQTLYSGVEELATNPTFK